MRRSLSALAVAAVAFGLGFAAAHSIPAHADTVDTSGSTDSLACRAAATLDYVNCTLTTNGVVYLCASELGCGTHAAATCIYPPGLPPLCVDP
jgi:hypothetical protein